MRQSRTDSFTGGRKIFKGQGIAAPARAGERWADGPDYDPEGARLNHRLVGPGSITDCLTTDRIFSAHALPKQRPRGRTLL
jgi:hypothetical protein